MTGDGIRSEILGAYQLGQFFLGYENRVEGLPKPTNHLYQLGVMLWYATTQVKTRKRRTKMDVDKLVANWKELILALCLAHDKDEADIAEAAAEGSLVPVLAAPVKQLREFGPKLLAALKGDRRVPFVVWKAYEIWVAALEKAPDEEVMELKDDVAQEIAEMVSQDVKDQIPEALVKALRWRSAEKLERVKQVVTEEKAQGKKVRLRGRESCLFMEAGGTEEEPAVCIQI